MRATCIVVVLTLAGNTVYADGLLYKLPKDGTWATYQIDGNEKGREMKRGEVQYWGNSWIRTVHGTA